MTWVLKERLREALTRFGVDVVIAENSVTIPMNIPLGLAIVETVMETGIGCIAHHHDFVWERERFLVNAVDDQLRTAFPPMLSQIQHVAINSLAAREFSRRPTKVLETHFSRPYTSTSRFYAIDMQFTGPISNRAGLGQY